jgi:hypothetical protein
MFIKTAAVRNLILLPSSGKQAKKETRTLCHSYDAPDPCMEGSRLESLPRTGYFDRGLPWIFTDSPGQFWGSTSMKSRPLSSTSFPIHHSSTILVFDEI